MSYECGESAEQAMLPIKPDELAELRKDRERLDYFEKLLVGGKAVSVDPLIGDVICGKPIREAIDEARKGEK
jgi:hypothetical protein